MKKKDLIDIIKKQQEDIEFLKSNLQQSKEAKETDNTSESEMVALKNELEKLRAETKPKTGPGYDEAGASEYEFYKTPSEYGRKRSILIGKELFIGNRFY
jgi:hypothetical protein